MRITETALFQDTVIFVSLGIVILAGVTLGIRRKLRGRSVGSSLCVVVYALGAAVALWFAILCLCPGHSTRVLVRCCAGRSSRVRDWAYSILLQTRSSSRIAALIDLLRDSDRDTRHYAAECLYGLMLGFPEDESATVAQRGREALLAAIDDPDSDVAARGVQLLGMCGYPEDADVLMKVLRRRKDEREVCMYTVAALGRLGNARAIPDVLPFCNDVRRKVRAWAIFSLAGYDDPRAVSRLCEALARGAEGDSGSARSAMSDFLERYADPQRRARFDDALAAGARNCAFSLGHRSGLALAIANVEKRVGAYVSILETGGNGDADDHVVVLEIVVERLGEIGPPARSAVPVLRRTLLGPNPSLRRAASRALARIAASP